MVAHAVLVKSGPTSSTMAVPHGPASVAVARRRLRRDLGDREIPDAVIDDAVLILSELLSNSCRYARPLPIPAALGDEVESAAAADLLDPDLGETGGILVRWQLHGEDLLALEVTDGGAATRPLPARPSMTSRGGRGLSIVGQLASDWGVRDAPGQVTVWALLPIREHCAPGARSA
ncbi:ATP-binding protein [Saccharothrix sp. ST-888]|uniref:ATP-binding protein n=1 Tax=Saccharothrix sp. ST-888 TaxID=1427391 RepID=UPI00061F46FE|nr:anti-sigma regulatory factor [Saccharothrix sp. ST-888]